MKRELLLSLVNVSLLKTHRIENKETNKPHKLNPDETNWV